MKIVVIGLKIMIGLTVPFMIVLWNAHGQMIMEVIVIGLGIALSGKIRAVEVHQLDTSYCEEIDYLIGDINSDSIINILDVIETINIILNNNYDVMVDMDNNQQVNVLDVIQLINIILNN